MARTKEQYLKAKRDGMARLRAKDPVAARKQQADWRMRNHDREKAKVRAYFTKRFFWCKAMKLKGASKATPREIAALWRIQRGVCALTGRKLDRTAHLDHKVPKARGGPDELSNLQWLCQEANLAKRAMTDTEFHQLCSDVVRHRHETLKC